MVSHFLNKTPKIWSEVEGNKYMKKNLKQNQKKRRMWGLAARLEHTRIKEKRKKSGKK